MDPSEPLPTLLLTTGTPAGSATGSGRAGNLGEARLLMGVVAVVLILLVGLLLLTLARRFSRKAALEERVGRGGAAKRRQKSAWVEAGKRARPVEPDGSLPDDDEPRDKDDLEETH